VSVRLEMIEEEEEKPEEGVFDATPLSEDELHIKCVELHAVLAIITRDEKSFQLILSFMKQEPHKY